MTPDGINPDAFERDIREDGVEEVMEEHGVLQLVLDEELDLEKVKDAVVAWASWREAMRNAGVTSQELLSGERGGSTAADAWSDLRKALENAREKAREAEFVLPGLWPDHR